MINKNILFAPLIWNKIYIILDFELELEYKLYNLLAINIYTAIDIPIKNSVENNKWTKYKLKIQTFFV